MSVLDEILDSNKQFVTIRQSEYQQERLSKKPQKQLAIFTCMDTRLVDFLEPAMGISRGDAKIIKNAGNTIIDPQGGILRSLVVAVFLLGVEEILVIGHKDCGMAEVDLPALIDKMEQRGIRTEDFLNDEQSFKDWLGAFHDPIANIEKVVDIIRNSPMIPNDVPIHGLIFCPNDGHLEVVTRGY